MRPTSVVKAEGVYLASIVVVLVNTAIAWTRTWELLTRNQAVMLTVIGAAAVALAVQAILLYLTTRRASRVARWLLVLVTAIGVVATAWQAATGELAGGIVGILAIVGVVLTIVSVTLLFRPDAQTWFAARRAEHAA